jgi:MoxR-like ATPase
MGADFDPDKAMTEPSAAAAPPAAGPTPTERVQEAARRLRELQANIARVMVGKEAVIRFALVPLLCRSHLLLEDVPGVGKTTLAKAIARSIGGRFRRIQFTPDLLPLDVTGSTIFNQASRQFEFHQGPVFTHVLLADEINRATPRTQSALLECMEEAQVSVDGQTHPLPPLFFVVATQNPIEHTGTFPLPETQLDRFMMRLRLGYPTEEEEVDIFERQAVAHPLESLEPCRSVDELLELVRIVPLVHLHPDVKSYVARLVRATREADEVALGASPRATLHLMRASQALAMLTGLSYVPPDVVKAVAPAVLAHRVVLKPHAQIRGATGHDVVRNLLGRLPVPVAFKRGA